MLQRKHAWDGDAKLGRIAPALNPRIGGRDRDRTGDPLLAKRTGKNTKQLCWCRLRGKSTKFPLLKYPEVVPKSRNRKDGGLEGKLRYLRARLELATLRLTAGAAKL